MKFRLVIGVCFVARLLSAQEAFVLLPQDKLQWNNAALVSNGFDCEFNANLNGQGSWLFSPTIFATNLSYLQKLAAINGSLGANALAWSGRGHLGTTAMIHYNRTDRLGKYFALRSGMGLGHINSHRNGKFDRPMAERQVLFNLSTALCYRNLVVGAALRNPTHPKVTTHGLGFYAAYQIILGHIAIKPLAMGYVDRVFFYMDYGIELTWKNKHSLGYYFDWAAYDWGTATYSIRLNSKLNIGIATKDFIRSAFGTQRHRLELFLRWHSAKS